MITIADMPRFAPRVDRDPRPSLGQLLRQWRAARGVSQLELALRAGFSTRHVSFVETGRTHASRQTVLTLAEALDVPLRERNRLLEAAGYARVYRHTPLPADEMSHLRGVLQFLLDRHEPYAAIVLDRYSNCLMGNRASARMVAALVDDSLVGKHANHLRLVFHPLGARRWIVNWEEVARHLLGRAERELEQAAPDQTAFDLLGVFGACAAVSFPPSQTCPATPGDLLMPIHIRKPDLDLRIFSTIMTFGTPQDVTLQELRLETFFPADAESEAAWRQLTR